MEVRNRADNLVHASQKSLTELGDKVSAEEKTAIEAAITELKQALSSDNKDEIEAKSQVLSELSGKLAEKLYAQEGGAAPEGFTQAAEAAAQKSTKDAKDSTVVDAEYEEVKDNKR